MPLDPLQVPLGGPWPDLEDDGNLVGWLPVTREPVATPVTVEVQQSAGPPSWPAPSATPPGPTVSPMRGSQPVASPRHPGVRSGVATYSPFRVR